jgi:drug/metabolite transporter (DMT)-like permease
VSAASDATRQRAFATSMLVLLTAVWGLTFPATKAALADTDPIQFLALRFLLGLGLLSVLSRLLRKNINHNKPSGELDPQLSQAPAPPVKQESGTLHPFWLKLRRERIQSVVIRGIIVGIFLFVGFALQVQGLKLTTASRSGFFTGLLVVMVPPMAMLLRTSRSPLASWLALLPAVAGVYLLAEPALGGLNTGDILTIFCAFVFALQMVVLEALSRHKSEAMKLTIAQVGTVAALATVWSLIQGLPFHLTGVGFLALLYTGIFGTVIAVWMQTRFQPDVPAGHAALLFQLEPVFAATFAWALLGDLWTVRGLAGAGLILAATTLSSFGLLKNG